MKFHLLVARAVFIPLILLGVAQAQIQYAEQPPPIVGNGIGGTSNQGTSLALSADGNTVLTGAPGDNGQAGAAWVFIRTAGMWTQQGGKLVGSGVVGAAPTQQGASVALSADGNTAVIGGPGDNSGVGAVWVFTRSGGVWTQQGGKLTASGASGSAAFGSSVALSADGGTLIAGGPGDTNGVGAAWIFTRSGVTWTQAGKLVGTGAVGNAQQGYSVALSGDANWAMVGGPGDSGQSGAVWVFLGGSGLYVQWSGKLVGTGAVGSAQQGFSVALSGDGNTALIGGPGDNSNNGAAWVFGITYIPDLGGPVPVWMQEGSKLVGNEVPFAGAQQGASVALTSDGSLALVGAPGLKNGGLLPPVGAAFAYTRNSNNPGYRELTIVESGNATGSTLQGASVAISSEGSTVVIGGPGQTTASIPTGAVFAFILQQPRDFNADGLSDALLYDPVTGTSYTALSNGDGTYSYVYNLFTPGFDTLRTCDFNDSFKADLRAGLLLYNSHTALGYAGLSNGDGTFSFQSLFWSPGYDVVECADVSSGPPTSPADVVLYNSSTGALYVGFYSSGNFSYESQTLFGSYVGPGPGFTTIRVARFETILPLIPFGNPPNQLLFYNPTNGQLYLAYLQGGASEVPFYFEQLGVGPGLFGISPGYDFVDVADINGDGYADAIFYNSTNGNAATAISKGEGTFTFTPHLYSPGFTSVHLADFTGDGLADVTLYNKNTGIAYFGKGDGTGNFTFQSLFWSPGYDSVIAEDVNGDGKADVLLYNSVTGTLYTAISNGYGTFNYTYSYWGIGKVLAK